MGHHGPETEHGRRGHTDSQHRDVPLEDGVDEVLPPGQRIVFAPGQERSGESSPQPKPLQPRNACFFEAESRDGDGLHAPGQGFGSIPHEAGRGAAQDQEPGPYGHAISQHLEDGKQLRCALDFVEDDDALLFRFYETCSTMKFQTNYLGFHGKNSSGDPRHSGRVFRERHQEPLKERKNATRRA